MPGLPVATNPATRMVPPLLPSPRTVTPMPAIVKRLPTMMGMLGVPSTARRLALGGRAKLQQRHIGSGAMRQHCLHVEAGMDGDRLHILQ